METERDWHIVRRDDRFDWKDAGMGALRFALLFGLCAAALAAIVMPGKQDRSDGWLQSSQGLDPISVGSINQIGAYTARKSMLQSGPGSNCIIRRDGSRAGIC